MKPGCALVVCLFLLLLALLVGWSGISSLTGGGPVVLGIFAILFSIFLALTGAVIAKESFETSKATVVLSPDENPMERFGKARAPEEREIASLEITERSRAAAAFTNNEKKILGEVLGEVRSAPTPHEVIKILGAIDSREPRLANPKLQPIAFALKRTTVARFAAGSMLDILAWVAFLISIPVTMLFLTLSGVLRFGGLLWMFLVWKLGKALLRRTLRASRRAGRYRIRADKVLKRDARDPILYLRSFLEEYDENSEKFSPATSEERLAAYYNSYGPVIAVGEPKEEMPQPGAFRIYFDDATWKAGVLYLMSVSSLVVIDAGIAPGLLWELGVARKTLDPSRLMITFVGWRDLNQWERHLRYLRFKKYADRLLGCELAPELGSATHIKFSPDWEPVAVAS